MQIKDQATDPVAYHLHLKHHLQLEYNDKRKRKGGDHDKV